MTPSKINIELVPQSCWFSNVRSQVSTKDWDKLRKHAYANANYRCEICSAAGQMQAHEIWHYDDRTLVQKLQRITCVCRFCHELYHLGFASINNRLDKAMAHLARINQWNKMQTSEYVQQVFKVWQQRSTKRWTLDLHLLDEYGIAYSLVNKTNQYRDDII